jgi:hypothetical protein
MIVDFVHFIGCGGPNRNSPTAVLFIFSTLSSLSCASKAASFALKINQNFLAVGCFAVFSGLQFSRQRKSRREYFGVFSRDFLLYWKLQTSEKPVGVRLPTAQEEPMLYHSTRSNSVKIDSAQAVLQGLAPDGGLYMPENLPGFDWKACLRGDTYEMATQILSAMLPDIQIITPCPGQSWEC